MIDDNSKEFIKRHIGPSEEDQSKMLQYVGYKTLEDLMSNTVPEKILLKEDLKIDQPMSENDALKKLKSISKKNKIFRNFIGMGYYNSITPNVILRNILENPGWYTSYTPYQPEISQGTLQYLYEFQTQVSLLTGMDISNASMYDGSTAAAEAVSMAKRITKRNEVILSNTIHPHYADVIKTVSGIKDSEFVYNRNFSIDIDYLFNEVDENTACVVVQNPDFFGSCYDLSSLAEFVQSKGALLIVVVTEVLSLGMMKSPGAMGADIVACEGQSLGNPMNFGGPYVGLLSTKNKYLRQIPGRIVGESEDVDGKKGFVLTLSAREQHIRREKATSNICTNSGLCSLAFTIHLTLLGEKGFKSLSRLNHESALNLKEKILKIPEVKLLNKSFFNEFTIELPIKGEVFVDRMAEKGVLAGIPVSRLINNNKELDNFVVVASTETNTEDDMNSYIEAANEVL